MSRNGLALKIVGTFREGLICNIEIREYVSEALLKPSRNVHFSAFYVDNGRASKKDLCGGMPCGPWNVKEKTLLEPTIFRTREGERSVCIFGARDGY